MYLLLTALTALAADPGAVEAALTAPPGAIAVALYDQHPLHGGDRYVLSEDGALEHGEKRRGPEPESVHTLALSDGERQALQSLLLDLRAWEQRVPESTPAPGQMKTRLVLTVDGDEIEIWEWHNDLEANDRLVQVERWLAARAEEGE